MSHTVQELIDLVMQQAKEKGFGTKPEEVDFPEKMLLLHSEISEAYEAYRKKRFEGKDNFHEEMGDILQRLLHICGIYGIDIEKEVLKKLEANKTRDWDWKKYNEKHS